MNKEEKEYKTRTDFINEFLLLCDKYGYCIVSDDPYCGVYVEVYDKEIRDYYQHKWRG